MTRSCFSFEFLYFVNSTLFVCLSVNFTRVLLGDYPFFIVVSVVTVNFLVRRRYVFTYIYPFLAITF